MLGGCWLAACSFPEYGFDQAPAPPPPSICADGLPSEAETGIDCGGGCMPCDVGEPCEVERDCVTLACFDGMCRPPACDDGVKNGAETDRDCGGQCPSCETGRDCGVPQDCASRVCSNGRCQAPTCLDQVENGVETSMDCGGECPPCASGDSCQSDSDCTSNKCLEEICVDPGCTDEVKNGLETDVDCGGGQCGRCVAERACLQPEDCESSICDDTKHCTAASCEDAVQNGDESDADCGGGSCPGCDKLLECNSPEDCASMTCQSGLCVPAEATGALISRLGWNASASNTHEFDVPNEAIDGAASRWSSGASQAAGMYFEVDMQELQALFSIQMYCDVVGDAPLMFDVYLSKDGDFSDEQPVREDLPGLGPTTVVDFATAQVARYIRIVLSEGQSNWWCIDEFTVYE